MRSREARFIGHGNFATGEGHCRINAWRLTCSQCRDIKVIAMPHGDLPPTLLIKKFHQAGWNVGKRATADLCGACQQKQKQKQGQAVAMPAPTVLVTPPPERPTTAPPPPAPPPDKPATAPPPVQDCGVITITVLRYKELTEAWQKRAIKADHDKILMNIHALLCAGKIDGARQAIEVLLPAARATTPPAATRVIPAAKTPRVTPAETIMRDNTFDEWLDNLEKNHRASHAGPPTNSNQRKQS